MLTLTTMNSQYNFGSMGAPAAGLPNRSQGLELVKVQAPQPKEVFTPGPTSPPAGTYFHKPLETSTLAVEQTEVKPAEKIETLYISGFPVASGTAAELKEMQELVYLIAGA